MVIKFSRAISTFKNLICAKFYPDIDIYVKFYASLVNFQEWGLYGNHVQLWTYYCEIIYDDLHLYKIHKYIILY